MEGIEQLVHEYFLLKFGFGNFQRCIDWAIERLLRDQEDHDLDIVLLAAATTHEDTVPLAERIVQRYGGPLDEQVAAGKYVASLRRDYLQGRETIESLDAKLTKLEYSLGYPDWLVMLSRNCEYATDIPEFQGPFEQELAYIADLWESATTRAEFEARYSRAVSNQHDV